ncbi:unnamed protein product, partial [Chrysoparadoxa australica]
RAKGWDARDLAGRGSASMENHFLRCNSCWGEASGTCFRTRCKHVFCETCAYQHFSEYTSCPACGMQLQEADIKDFIVGVPLPQFQSSCFQQLYTEAGLENSANAAIQMMGTMQDSLSLLLQQMLVECTRASSNQQDLT